MSKWNEIPLSEDTPAEEKAEQFDRQYEENRRDAKPDNSNPYSKENFEG